MSADGERRSHDRLRRLFDFLISEGSSAGRSARRPGPLDVTAALDLAARQKVSWAFARRLLEGRGPGPDEPALAAVRDCAQASAEWREVHRAQLVELYRTADAPLLHVKGFAVEAWNGGRFVRDSGDVDVVVPDLPLAVAVLDRLLGIGYRLDETCWLHRAPGGRLEGVLIAVSERPGEPPRCVELSIGGFPAASFTPALPLAREEGVDLRVDGTAVRIANRMQSLLVLCAETMHRELVLRDAMDLVLVVEAGGPGAIVPELLAAAGAAQLGWALGRLARFVARLLPDRPDQAERRAWLGRVTAGTRPALGAWPSVAQSLASGWGPRRAAGLMARYVHHRAESWLFDRDRALALIQRVNRRRDPLAILTGSGAPVFTIPVHSGPTGRLRMAPGIRVAAEDPEGVWWGAVHEGRPLLVLPVGVYLLSVDCVLEPADIDGVRADLAELAGLERA